MRPPRSSRALLSSTHSFTARPQCPSHLQHSPRPRPQRSFSTTPCQQKRKPPHKSLSAKEMERITAARASLNKAYSESEKEELNRRYTPAQVKSIELGEKAIDPAHLADQAKTRSDVLRPKYLSDFSRISPVIDKSLLRLRGEGSNYAEIAVRDNKWREAPNAEAATKEFLGEILDPLRPEWDNIDESGAPSAPALFNDVPISHTLGALAEGQGKNDLQENDFQDLDHDAAPKKHSYNVSDIEEAEHEAFVDYMRSNPAYLEKNKSHRTPFERLAATLYNPRDSPDVAPMIPKINDPTVRWTNPAALDERASDEDTAIAWVNMARVMGVDVPSLYKYRTRVLVQHRVVNQTRMGKIPSIYILCAAGNEDGMLGLGEGKSAELNEARREATLTAIRNMVPIHRYEQRTIFGEVRSKVGASELRMMAKPPGYGLRCSSHVHEMARCAGITDLASKILRSRNPMNVCKAVWEGLKNQRHPEDIARGRGRKLVDVRKVYYGGLLG